MDEEENKDEGLLFSSYDVTEARSAVNPTILDYYKKFGRKRDLEQYFSLSTAQNEVRDPSSLFWRNMKAENESSDSSDKNETSTEICRISVKCSVMDQSSSQESDKRLDKSDKSESVSPPIITEDVPPVEGDTSRHSDNESNKSDDNQSHKSIDGTLDTSAYKPQSPASSVTSQRKLEWDSLADVGYANENERIASSSSLSTLERLALKQQYSDNQSHIGMPTAQSTPVEEQQARKNNKRQPMKKTTEIHKKDVDVFEINVPHSSNQMPSQSINVSLTKHISFNVENSGVKVDSTQRQVNITPNVVSEPIVTYPETVKDYKFDKEIQTSLRKTKESDDGIKAQNDIGIPVIISLNTLKRRMRKRKTRRARKKPSKTQFTNKNISEEKTGDQVSDAESFEYMPGHIYNQNKLKDKLKDKQKSKPVPENKSSMESSGGLTTGSSKASNISFTKDLDKCIDSIKLVMQEKHDDTIVKKKLIKDIVQRLLKSKYKDDESTTDFLSGLSINSKRLGLPRDYTTTSTSDANNSEDKKTAKKSILRSERFNANMLASTSQSAPNIPSVAKSEDLASKLVKQINSSSEISSKCKDSSDNSNAPRTSSEELYHKYLIALKREQAYKVHLQDKEKFVRQKLVGSDSALRQPVQTYMENSKLRDLIKDLTRNNYDDGSGDASKLEGGGINSYGEESRSNIRKQKSHSRFTLSDNSEQNKRKIDPNHASQDQLKSRGLVKNTHYCCCPLHLYKIDGIDSGCQVNIQTIPAGTSGNANKAKKMMKECQKKPHSEDCGCYKTNEEIAVIKSSQRRYMQSGQNSSTSYTNSIAVQSDGEDIKSGSSKAFKTISIAEKCSQSSQTNISLNLNSTKNNNNTAVIQNIIFNRAHASSPVKIKSTVGTKEVTRWIQTEISIDPKISDPSITDINILNEIDGGIVEEPVSSKTGSVASSRSIKSVTSQDCFKPTFGSSEYVAGQKISETQCVIEEPSSQINTNPPSQYSIPVQGTNVKLMLSITPQLTGSQVVQTCSSNIDIGISTDYEGVENKATCLEDECSKCVQVEGITPGFEKSTAVTECPCKSVDLQVDEIIHIKECTEIRSDSVTSDPLCKCTKKDSGTLNDKQGIFASKQQSESKKAADENEYGCYGTIGYQTCTTKTTEFMNKGDNKYSGFGSRGHQATTDNKIENNNNKSGNYGSYSTTGNRPCSAKITENNKSENYRYYSTTGNRPSSAKINDKNDQNTYGAWASSHQQYQTFKECYENAKEHKFYSFTTNNNDDANIPGTAKQQTGNIVIDSTKPPPPDKLWAMNHDKNSCPTYKCKEDSQKSKEKSKSDQNKQCYVNVFYDDGQTQRFATFPNLPKKRVVYSHTDPNCQCTANFPTGPCPSGFYYENQTYQTQQYDNQRYQNPAHEKVDIQNNVTTEKFVRQTAFEQFASDKSDKSSSKASSAAKSKKDYKDELEMQYENYKSYKREDQVDSKLKRDDSFFLERPKDSSGEDIQRSSDENQRYNIDEFDKDPLMKIIKDITTRYTKKDNAKGSKKKCFKEILSLLNYLLDTEDSIDRDAKASTSEQSFKTSKSVQCDCYEVAEKISTVISSPRKNKTDVAIGTSNVNLKSDSERKSKVEVKQKQFTDKEVQSKSERNYVFSTESSELPTSSDLQISSDSTTCKILSRIKRECEKYHQKKCRSGSRKYDVSSSTSINCENCKKIHYCGCRIHKCKPYKMKSCCDKKRRPVAYNLIIQPSDSVVEEETPIEMKQKLKNIVVKVPSKKFSGLDYRHSSHKHTTKYEKEYQSPSLSPPPECHRQCYDNMTPNVSNNSAPQGAFCVREYLERNRPDFIENTSKRQDCLKTINECRSSKSSAVRRLLSMQLEGDPALNEIDVEDLMRLSKELGMQMRNKKAAPKFISEREMKKHSRKIYKTLPEVQLKKEEIKKENNKKTNLLMANIFKKNLQRKTLRGTVNLSTYSSVIKI